MLEDSKVQPPVKLIAKLSQCFAKASDGLYWFANFSVNLANKEASTVLCSVVKHAGNGRARMKCRGKHET